MWIPDQNSFLSIQTKNHVWNPILIFSNNFIRINKAKPPSKFHIYQNLLKSLLISFISFTFYFHKFSIQ